MEKRVVVEIPSMENSRLVCILSVEFRTEGSEVTAHCPELQLTDHGATEQQAEERLRASVGGFIRICAKHGTLIKVLQERGVLGMERQPDRYIQVPVPLVAFETAGTTLR
jgi:hypothetical protein